MTAKKLRFHLSLMFLIVISLTSLIIPEVYTTHGVGHNGQNVGNFEFAKIGDDCRQEMYEREMRPFHQYLATRDLSAARQQYNLLMKNIQSYGTTDKEIQEYASAICFGAALQCNEVNSTHAQCECLKLPGFKNFTFTESAGACKADVGTVCITNGFGCAQNLKCNLRTDECELDSNRSSMFCPNLANIPLIFVALYTSYW